MPNSYFLIINLGNFAKPINEPLDQGAIASMKSGYISWCNRTLIKGETAGKLDKMRKIIELHHAIPTNVITFCWRKAGLLNDEEPLKTIHEVDPDELEISRIENETLFDVSPDDLEEEIEDGLILLELEEVPVEINLPKKTSKQQKITSFFR